MRAEDVQLFASCEMFIIVEEIVTALSPGAGIDAAILAWLWRLQLTEGPGKGSRRIFAIGGNFWEGRVFGAGRGRGLDFKRSFRGRGEGLFGRRCRGREVSHEGRRWG